MTFKALPLALLLAVQALSAQSPLSVAGTASDLAFAHDYAGIGIESLCGADWFYIEHGHWKCVRKGAGDTLDVVAAGRLPDYDSPRVIRGPEAGDRHLLVAHGDGNSIAGMSVDTFDPVTLASTFSGNLPGGFPRTGLRVDRDGDGRAEVLVADPQTNRIVALPGGANPPYQTLATLPFIPTFSGQFDADPRTELGLVEPGFQFRLYDPLTLQVEPYQLTNALGGSSRIAVADWDGDGVDELAGDNCCTSELILIDPNKPGAPLTIQVAGHAATPLGLVDWRGGNSRDLVAVGRNAVSIIDPRIGSALVEFALPEFAGLQPKLFAALDWDGDADGDLLWSHVDGELWLLRNPGGATVIQRSARRKQVVGYATVADEARVVSVEEFLDNQQSRLAVRTREAQTLALRSEFSLLFPSFATNGFDVGEIHPAPGSEIIRVGGSAIALYTVQGSLLWERTPDGTGLRGFDRIHTPEPGCKVDACRRILALDKPHFGGVPRLQMLDGANGTTLWTSPDLPTDLRALALTDLNSDGVPDIIYSSDPGGTGLGLMLTALNGADRSTLWEVAPGAPLAVIRRTGDRANRLAALTDTGVLQYIDPTTGAMLRGIAISDQPNFFCGRCDLQYLSQGDTVGLWIVNNPDTLSLQTVRRDLRGDIWERSAQTAGSNAVPATSLGAASTGLVHTGTDGEFLYRLSVPDDGIFVDEFEGW